MSLEPVVIRMMQGLRSQARNYRLVGCEAWNASDSGNLTKALDTARGGSTSSRQADRHLVLRQFSCIASESEAAMEELKVR